MPHILTIHPATTEDAKLQEAVRIIFQGGIIIYPTETFYGIGVLYSNESALNKLFQIKNRDTAKPVLLLIPHTSFVFNIASAVSPGALKLAQYFWPGPLTLLLRASHSLSPLLQGTDNKVGLRVSSNSVVQRLMSFFKNAITSTSANLSGGKSPSCIEEIPEALINAVDLVIDAGVTPGGIPSTVFDVSQEPFTLVRPGIIGLEEIMRVLEYP